MDESVRRLRLNRFENLSYLIYIDFMRELGPEDDSGLWKTLPNRPRCLDSRQPRHLDVEYAQVGAMLERQIHRRLPIFGLYDGRMFCELSLKQFAQVMALSDVIFSN